MTALVDIHDDASVRRLPRWPTAWQHVGRGYYAADCLERVLLVDRATRTRTRRSSCSTASTGEWPVLVDLLGRRAVHVENDKDRAELYREIALVYERELGDASGALDAYREADRLEPDRPTCSRRSRG